MLGPQTLGIEVTVPGLAAGCGLGNIDLQHGNAPSAETAIEVAARCDLPPEGAFLITIRPDLDAFGAMAVLTMQGSGELIGAASTKRIALIARADRHDKGVWPGPRPLPSVNDPIQPDEGGLAAVADHAIPILDRVMLVLHWIATGEEPADYRERWAIRQRTLAEALEHGDITVRSLGAGHIAIVLADRGDALPLGYRLSPVVVAFNSRYSFQGGPPYRKFTVAQFGQGYLDMTKTLRELCRREPGWGGSLTIIGSPQGISSTLSLFLVTRSACRHLATRRQQRRVAPQR